MARTRGAVVTALLLLCIALVTLSMLSPVVRAQDSSASLDSSQSWPSSSTASASSTASSSASSSSWSASDTTYSSSSASADSSSSSSTSDLSSPANATDVSSGNATTIGILPGDDKSYCWQSCDDDYSCHEDHCDCDNCAGEEAAEEREQRVVEATELELAKTALLAERAALEAAKIVARSELKDAKHYLERVERRMAEICRQQREVDGYRACLSTYAAKQVRGNALSRTFECEKRELRRQQLIAQTTIKVLKASLKELTGEIAKLKAEFKWVSQQLRALLRRSRLVHFCTLDCCCSSCSRDGHEAATASSNLSSVASNMTGSAAEEETSWNSCGCGEFRVPLMSCVNGAGCCESRYQDTVIGRRRSCIRPETSSSNNSSSEDHDDL